MTGSLRTIIDISGCSAVGSALGSGPRGRGFKSRRLDQKTDRNFPVCFLLNVFRRDLRVEVRTGVSSLRIAAQKHRVGKQTAQRGALCTGARRQRRKSRRLDQIPRRDSFSAGDLFVAMEHECMTSCVPLPSALTPRGSPKRAQHFLGKRSGRQQGQRAFRKERARQTCLAATRFGAKRSWDWSEQSSFFYDCTAVFSAERERT